MIRAQPMDAVVLIGGCDKTVPAQLMAAASADIPAIMQITGPMQVGHYRGEILGACTDCRRLWPSIGPAGWRRCRSTKSAADWLRAGTCMVMGTASTMASLTEALGMTLPGSARSRRPPPIACAMPKRQASGPPRWPSRGPRPSEIMTAAAFRNAMVTLQALGGSTNGLVHLAAIAGASAMPLISRSSIGSARGTRLGRHQAFGRALPRTFPLGGGTPGSGARSAIFSMKRR